MLPRPGSDPRGSVRLEIGPCVIVIEIPLPVVVLDKKPKMLKSLRTDDEMRDHNSSIQPSVQVR